MRKFKIRNNEYFIRKGTFCMMNLSNILREFIQVREHQTHLGRIMHSGKIHKST